MKAPRVLLVIAALAVPAALAALLWARIHRPTWKIYHNGMWLERSWRMFEDMGHMPDYSQNGEERVAERTSWWGRPLNSATFWSNRVPWGGYSEAIPEANRFGRFWPPPPFDDPSIKRSRADVRRTGSSLPDSGYFPGYVENDYERVFWNKWSFLLPYDPRYIDQRQRDRPSLAERDGFPPEAFTSNALAAVRLNARDANERPGDKDSYDAWKYDYLDRLRREGWNERYIDGYIAYWKLDGSQLKEVPNSSLTSAIPHVPQSVWEKAIQRRKR